MNSVIGEPLLRLDECDSTNRVALDWTDAPHGAAVVARVQTRGRGRLGRKWESAPDQGLYLSLVLHRESGTAIYSLLSALGAARAVEKLTGITTGVKWPNDVLAISGGGQARKIGGILGESRGERLVIGVGINVNQTTDELPTRPIFPASSLRIESGQGWECEAVLAAISVELTSLFTRFEAQSWNDLRAEFERTCVGIGEVVQVKLAAETVIGVFDSIGGEGALILRTTDGFKRILAGDVAYF